MELIDYKTKRVWTAKEVRKVLRAQGWVLKQKLWRVPVNKRYPPCFSDKLITENPGWVAYWFLEEHTFSVDDEEYHV